MVVLVDLILLAVDVSLLVRGIDCLSDKLHCGNFDSEAKWSVFQIVLLAIAIALLVVDLMFRCHG